MNLLVSSILLLLLIGSLVGFASFGSEQDGLLHKLEKEMAADLDRILAFWKEHMPDSTKGGFYGRMDGHGRIQPQAPKGAVMNSRILWTFAAASQHTKQKEDLQIAKRAYEYMLNHFVDKEHGGVYWALNYEGIPVEKDKQIYAQSFAIYAFSEYYRATREERALQEAVRIFELVEKHSFDPDKNGYYEGFTQDWKLSSSLNRLGGGLKQSKNMNTHLHLLEAYTNLYTVWKSPNLEKQLLNLLTLFEKRFLNKAIYRYYMFFDPDWHLTSEDYSYGHDIEASWLLCRASEVVDQSELHQQTQSTALKVVEATLAEGFDKDGSLFYTGRNGKVINKEKSWWPQAEAIIGLVNAHLLAPEKGYDTKAWQTWSFVRNTMLDPQDGEWFSEVRRSGKPNRKLNKVGSWKAPYHNGRACMEVMRRVGSKE